MTVPENTAQALNKAMMEAVEFVHAEGWDAAPTLFALVPTRLLADQLADPDEAAPLTLVVQDLPEHILPGSDELGDYLSRLAWPELVEGVVLAQEIMFRDSADPTLADARPARLFSGVLREEGGAFAEDNIELRGGPDVAPGVLQALRFGLEQDPDPVD